MERHCAGSGITHVEAEGDAAKGFRAGNQVPIVCESCAAGAGADVWPTGENGKNWLLIKRRDEYARPDEKSSVVTRKPKSVLIRSVNWTNLPPMRIAFGRQWGRTPKRKK